MWITIREYGLFGVIFSSIIAAVVEIILLHSGIRARFNFQYNRFKILVVPAVVFSCILVLEPMFGDTSPNLTHLLYVVGCILLLLWVYRQEIKLVKPFNILR
jgi:energy-converting hydrogenase Eha subunit A